MIHGIGIDIIELKRIEQLLDKNNKLADRIFTENEKEIFEHLTGQRRVEYAAGRFAAKEAFVKAVGTGISGAYGFQDIEVLNEPNGRPVLYALVTDAPKAKIHVSISHSREWAAAQVIIEE